MFTTDEDIQASTETTTGIFLQHRLYVRNFVTTTARAAGELKLLDMELQALKRNRQEIIRTFQTNRPTDRAQIFRSLSSRWHSAFFSLLGLLAMYASMNLTPTIVTSHSTAASCGAGHSCWSLTDITFVSSVFHNHACFHFA